MSSSAVYYNNYNYGAAVTVAPASNGYGYLPPALHQQQYQAPVHYVPTGSVATIQQQKSEGGVAEYVDYNFDLMTDFVVQNACLTFDREDALCITSSLYAKKAAGEKSILEIFTSGVNFVLNSIRLPSVSIYLALDYLSKYVSKFKNNNLDAIGGNSESVIYQNLIIALILANKFYDDKTFTNKSWAHATGVDLKVINKMEREWLEVFDWKLFDDKFVLYEEYCKSFEIFCLATVTKQAAELAQITTNMNDECNNGPFYDNKVCYGSTNVKSSYQTPVKLPSIMYNNSTNYYSYSSPNCSSDFASPVSSIYSTNVVSNNNGNDNYGCPSQNLFSSQQQQQYASQCNSIGTEGYYTNIDNGINNNINHNNSGYYYYYNNGNNISNVNAYNINTAEPQQMLQFTPQSQQQYYY
ncbi:Clg1p SCDLUD_002308 [Saccharomycodes ludwigii]|uniref:Clg1p n=1 Tax=Saccharomycodes ludwigii TaxID=36035 RepID=UPI001E8AC9B4|nr:hypothetical protein SCDLUD_002308 [Saccharomycodes ludwigii]KAH3900853.1 hypothetical protein SCDLUD_002308 [Saccharomycodes ludwigii]